MILTGEADFVLAGGAESMSQAPHVVRGARWGIGLGAPTQFEDMLWAALIDSYNGLPMAVTAENLAEQYHVTREEQDRFSLSSQQRAKDAWEKGRMAEEVVGVPLEGPQRQCHQFRQGRNHASRRVAGGIGEIAGALQERRHRHRR